MADRTCSVDGCIGQVLARSWCSTHYSRWYRTGSVERSRFINKRTPCAAVDCLRSAKSRGFCSMHYARWRKYGDPTGGGEYKFRSATGCCSVDGCEKPHLARGFCNMHHLRFIKHGDPTVVKRRSKRVCIDPRWDGMSAECVGTACENEVHVGGYCGRHYGLWKKYRLTPEAFDALLQLQEGVCVGCGKVPDKWHVDHDHSCCPGSETCGACIRGLLCPACNLILGRVSDDAALLRSLADYVDRQIVLRTVV